MGVGAARATATRTVNSAEMVNLKADFVVYEGDMVTLRVTQAWYGEIHGANGKRVEYCAGNSTQFAFSAFCDGDKRLLKEMKDARTERTASPFTRSERLTAIPSPRQPGFFTILASART